MEDYGISESTGGVVQEMSYEQISEIQPKQEKKLARNSHEYKAKRALLERRVAELSKEGVTANRIVAVLASENIGNPSGGALSEQFIYSIKQKLRFKESRAEASDRYLTARSLSEQAADYVSETEGPQPATSDGSEIPCAILRSDSMSDEKKVRILKAYFLDV